MTSDLKRPHGLSSEQAAHYLKSTGYNEIPNAESRGIFGIVFAVLREPMLLLLLSCAGVYLAMGEIKDAAILSISVFFVIGITLYQEWKAEKSIEALRDLSSPRALVIRDGQELRIPGREVALGDLLVLHEGDRVPADAVLLSSPHFKTDESLLTGESFSVSKIPTGTEKAQKDNPQASRLFSGTMVVAGHGIAEATATGTHTQMGHIGQSLGKKKTDDQTLLQKELGRLVRICGILGVGFSLLIAILYGLSRNNWPEGLLVGLSTAMSLLPEEFPVVLTVFLAIGAWRISRARVLTRRISATESLGSITVLCVDKTGTLTKNQMEVRILDENGSVEKLATDSAPIKNTFLLQYAALASQPQPFDPMEKAIWQTFNTAMPDFRLSDWHLVREYPLTHDLLAMTCVWKSPASKSYVVATKGAPEAILSLCKMSEEQKKEILQRVTSHGEQGLRVLGVAQTEHPTEELPEKMTQFSFNWVGLMALEDPVRPEVPAAVAECQAAGIRVVMMTGDYPATARTVGQQIGLPPNENVVTGSDVVKLSDSELRSILKKTSIFARMVPEQKLRIVQALKENGEIVGMTGDGVNDAPSLKWSDVGIAMGGRGTDVAREAAAIVLLDDNFTSIVVAIRLGRTIFDNIRKAVAYIFAVHVPIAGMAMLPVLFNSPLVLLPAHIVFLELVIDPACALLFEGEPAEANVMKRPPRKLGVPLFGILEIGRSTLEGLVALACVFSAYRLTLHFNPDASLARSVSFAALVLANLGLILVNRSRSSGLLATLKTKNPTFLWLVLSTLVVLLIALYLPPAQGIFRFSSPDGRGIAVAILCGLVTLALSYSIRKIGRPREPLAH